MSIYKTKRNYNRFLINLIKTYRPLLTVYTYSAISDHIEYALTRLDSQTFNCLVCLILCNSLPRPQYRHLCHNLHKI